MNFPEPIQLDEPSNETNPGGLIQRLKSQLDEGKTIVPLVGAGASAPSGIPTAPELEKYLTLCVGMALGVVEPTGVDEPTKAITDRWHPKLNSWPAMRGNWLLRANRVEKRIKKRMTHPARRDGATPLEWHPRRDQRRTEANLYREAFADLRDWRIA